MNGSDFGPFRGVLFDVDGTLADSTGLFYEMSLDLFRAAEVPAPDPAHINRLMSEGHQNPWRELFPQDFPDLDAFVARVIGERRDVWMSRYHRETEPHEGSVELVARLARDGFILGIVTSSERELPFLERWGIRAHFGAVVGREDVEQRKPHPEPIERCLGALALDPADAVYIGDSLIDIRAAHAAGVRAVGVTTGTSTREAMQKEGADLIVDSLFELDPWLTRPSG